MELETINKLYLELSQVAKAKTARELSLESRMRQASVRLYELSKNPTPSVLVIRDIAELLDGP